MRPRAFLSAVLCCALLSIAWVPRTGFVSLLIDDTHELHYSYVFPLLEGNFFKGNFAYITEVSDLGIEFEAWKIQEIARAGHEILDHTTRHDYTWATHVDTLKDGVDDYIPWTFADVATWDSLCERSLYILDSLGIACSGWNQPGGCSHYRTIPGQPDWMWQGRENDSLYSLIGGKYSYGVGYGVSPMTAHLNLRGHNCPERFPFFNVPHQTIDGSSLEEIKTGVADAVASGLWYPALSHCNATDRAFHLGMLVIWLYEQDIEVLTCSEAIDRIMNGMTDPYANQLPQAPMLLDRDLNGKPDGFTGDCAWDTSSAVPEAGCNAMDVFGDVEFCCYGPEVGRNSISVYMKTIDGTSGYVRIIYTKYAFDWELLGVRWNTVLPSEEWTLMDSTVCSTLALDVEEEVDRIAFLIRPVGDVRVKVACPSLLLAAAAGVGAYEELMRRGAPLTIAPNPARKGEAVRVLGSSSAAVYDVGGRSILDFHSPAGALEVMLPVGELAPGVYIVRDPTGSRSPAKVVISR